MTDGADPQEAPVIPPAILAWDCLPNSGVHRTFEVLFDEWAPGDLEVLHKVDRDVDVASRILARIPLGDVSGVTSSIQSLREMLTRTLACCEMAEQILKTAIETERPLPDKRLPQISPDGFVENLKGAV